MAQFEIRRSTNNQYYWVFQGNNNEIICTSETYTTRQSAVNAIEVVKRQGPTAGVSG